MVAYSFNAAQYEPKYSGGGGLPLGPNKEPQKYKVIIINEEQMPTAKGDGGFLKLTMRCIEGPQTGVEQFDNLNLHNPNAKAVEIANKQLSAYCHVTQQFVLQDTAQLRNIPFIIEVRAQKNNPEYTEIGAIFDINGNEPGKGAAQVQPAPQAPVPPPVQPAQPGPAAWAPNPAPAAEAAPAAPAAQGWGGQPAAPAPANGGWGNK